MVYQEKTVIVLELTCGFVTNVKENCARKVGKYNSTIVDLKKKYEKVAFLNLSMSALGSICKDDDGNGILQALKSIGLSELLSKSSSSSSSFHFKIQLQYKFHLTTN